MSRNVRAQQAKNTVNNVIPQILKTNPRARAGIENTEMINYSPVSEIETEQRRASSPIANLPKTSVVQADTLKAAQTFLQNSPPNSRIAVLNMASPFQPGGFFLDGALAQEEALCSRSTLYAALTQAPKASTFYPTPPLSTIYSPDVLVFRDESGKNLSESDFFYTDVISAAGICQPQLVLGVQGLRYSEKDRKEMISKVEGLFEVVKKKGITHLVLGAWGCGMYGNPPEEVAGIFKAVLLGSKGASTKEECQLAEVVFAIFDKGENLRIFEAAFSGV
ncbi:hypothetical protein HYFRA_00000016 [Hymenoscyphus fraxineus]|uniref:Microbial-type PARG catalytic domain-containing protein n=1 Tax=Hymenoscyphus fraxineus TaxID=746836 RepID=A0A9N9PS71_9HELO|nr:hypothetical protein HYFRA_00000016 [Hymenoscyphus fraxineus]